MQRYHSSNCNSAVNSNSIGVGSARDGSNASRRTSLLVPYKLKCDKEPLNSRLGPPDFHPQTSNCLEETLNREFLQSGYRETVEGLEEAREINLSQAQSFTRPVVLKCRESIRKCLRAINESRAQKRKAGQVYGVPLSGILLSRPNVFPEQKAFSDDFKKKWIEGLSQPHKRLRTLADHVPHGYRRKSLFEVLIRNNVPLLRATWFIKVNYLNQIRPSAAITAGTPDKSQQTRKELWTKDFVEYLQYLLDEFVAKGNVVHVGEDPSLHFKWWYVVRLMHWHRAEGLLSASGIIDWVLVHLHEKDGIEISQLMLPIIYGFLDDIILSQTYVRTLANVAVRFIRDPSPGGSHLVDNSRRAYTTSALIELLRYLILSVPDTFVGIDCFPLPQAVTSYAEGTEGQYQSLSLGHVVQSIQARAGSLSKAACGGYPSRSVVRAVQELDRAVAHGDVNPAVDCLFEKFCDGAVDPAWVDEITPRLKASLRWIGNVCVPYISSVFLLLEWATCDFRDFRTSPPEEVKLSGGKDFSEVYVASRILKQKVKTKTKAAGDLFESPGVLHDIVVCWIDQRDGDSVKRVEFLIAELIRVGVFYPPAYVRQLLGSGAMDAVDEETGRKHCRLLKHLPASFVRYMFQEGNFVDGDLSEVMRLYSNERRLFLNSFPKDDNRNDRAKSKAALSEVKTSVAMFLKFTDTCVSSESGIDESQGSTKKSELTEGPPAKKQKLNEEQVSDEEDTWWVRKGPKRVESPKLDPPLKSTKQLAKGRQKNVRKTQSLAQLAATRTDTNYVASTSHVCDSKISCAHRLSQIEDMAAIGRTLKRLRLPEKKAVVNWLTTVARQLVEDSVKASLKVNQFGRSQDRVSSPTWKLGEDELSSLLYMIDACEDPLSAAKFVLWLIPKVPSSNIHVGRNIMMQKNNENNACDVAEAFMLSSLRRYERTILAADLVTEVLTAVMNRVTVTISSVGRVPGASLTYARYLLRKYGSTRSVSEWENSFKSSCDKRLAAELDCVRSNDAELGYPLGIPAGVDNVDDFLRQKINVNKLSRIGITMRDIVLRNIDEALREKKADGGRLAQQIVSALMECIRQTGGAAQEGDPNLLSSAVSAVVHSVGLTFSKMTDNSSATTRRVLQIHISCLSLLKEALGQRQNRVFEIALAIEATSALASKTSRNDAKCTAAISALVVGAIVHGVSNLERMVSVFRLKDGIDVVQYLKTNKPNGNGSSRSVPVPVPVDVYVHWFRLLVGNCRTVCDGLVAQLVGESYIAAFITMQRSLPIAVVFPPAYSIFSFVVWKQIILNSISNSSREDFQSLLNSMSVAISDSIKHSSFRNILLRDSQSLYDLVSEDSTSDAEFASLVDAKYTSFLPLRGRQFFNVIIECKFPAESGLKLLDNIVDTLDFLQPAKFHWQWVELRLLLNEQAVVEKVETHDMSFPDAIRSVSSVSENENNIIEVILARLLVRPDAGPLYSDLIHLLGKSLEDSMLKQVKWFLGGSDVLYGRKSVRQRLVNIAESKGISIKAKFWKPWGWSKKRDGRIEEEEAGEVTEKALVEVVIPCVDRSSEDSRNSFASDLIKQLNNIEQQINSGNRGSDSKSSNRKGMKVGSPGLNKRAESVVLSPTALRSSLSLRLRLLVRLFPSILSDGEPSGRNMRHVLASVIIRLLGSRFVLDEDERFIFDRLLLLLHALLSASPPCWLSSRKPAKDVTGFDRDVLENLQNELDRMALPASVRWQIQTAMPILNFSSSPRFSISCNVKENAPSIPNSSPRSSAPSRNASGKSKGPPAQQEADAEIDPWTLLEDGTGLVQAAGGSSIGNGDHGNVRACNWLRGAVRVRRADLSYIGPVDDDS